MISSSIARRYAKAIYGLASEEGRVEESGKTLEVLAAAVESAGLAALAPGLLTKAQRAKLATELAAALEANATLSKALSVMAQADRLDQFVSVASWFRKLDDEAAGRVRIDLTTAVELSQKEVDGIVAKFAEKAKAEVIAEVAVSDELIGGVQVQMQGRVYDGSIRTQLARLRSRMAGSL